MDINQYLQRSGGQDWYNVPYIIKEGDTAEKLQNQIGSRYGGSLMSAGQYTGNDGEPEWSKILLPGQQGKAYTQSLLRPGTQVYLQISDPNIARQYASFGASALDTGKDFVGSNAYIDPKDPSGVALANRLGVNVPSLSQSTSTPTTMNNQASSYAGPSIVDFLSLSGQPSDYASRKTLAGKYGIANYTGTAAQNTQLLNLLRTNAPATPAPASAPTTTTDVNQIGGFRMPSYNPQNPDTSTVSGMLALNQKFLETKLAEAAAAEAERKAFMSSDLAKQPQGWLDKIMGSKSIDQTREDAYTQTGINPKDYFAEQQASLAEIETLNTELNATIAAKEQQIAASNDKMGSNNFINNQIAQIERNAAPKINQMSANIKSKAAIYEAKQGRFEEARQFAAQAVADATAALKFNVDMFQMFYQINQDTIDRLDSKYSNALKDAMTSAEKSYELATQDKMRIGELMISNPQAGITMNDTYESALTKVGLKPLAQKGEIFGSAEGGYYERYYDSATNTYKTRSLAGGTGGGGGGGTSDIDAYAEAYLNEEVDITNVPQAIRAKVLTRAKQIAEEALKKSQTTQTTTPKAPITPKSAGQGLGNFLQYNPYYQSLNPSNLLSGTGKVIGGTKDFFSGLFGY